MSSNKSKIAKLGIGGPVGSGKTKLIEMLVPILKRKNIRCGIISNDVISKEDAQRMQRTLSTESKLMPEDMIIGIATGGCPHTAVREDPSMNLAVIEEIEKKDPTLDLDETFLLDTDPIDTSINSNQVFIKHENHPYEVGDLISLTGAVSDQHVLRTFDSVNNPAFIIPRGCNVG